MDRADAQLASLKTSSRIRDRAGASTDAHEKTFDLNASEIEDASDAVIALDGDSRVTAWNRAAAQLYGLDAAAVLGRPFSEVITCESRAVIHAAHAGTRIPLPDGIDLIDGPATHLARTGTREGCTIPVHVSLFHVGPPGAGGGAGGGGAGRRLAFVRDDTEHVRLAASLEARLKFETLVADLSSRFSGLAEDQIDGEIEVWLRRLVEMLGVDRSSFAEVMPKGALSVTHTYGTPGSDAYPKCVAQTELPWLTAQFADGHIVVLCRVPDDLPAKATAERRHFVDVGMKSGIGIPIFIAGSLVCILTFVAFRQGRSWPKELIARLQLAGDVFANAIARRQAKQQFEQQQNELAHVARVAAMGELAAVIAHELDQPLTAIVSNAEAARYFIQQGEQPNLAEASDALQDVVDSAMRAAEIVKRERHLLRKSQLSREAVDLNEAVRDIELFIRAEARQAGAKVVLELVPGLPPVTGDQVQLQQVILNLARNGVQAMRDQPSGSRELTIRTAAGSAEVTLTISDAGPPADAVLLERMFEPFYTTKTNGLGMGLAISRSILEAHHGRIWAVRNPGGRGISVHVAIPRK
jgi:signal transduction histidine kinase